jgi:non-heme chloroperoxidase
MTPSIASKYLGSIALIGVAAIAATASQKEGQVVQVADGVSLHVMLAGKESALPTLVFIPGWGAGGYVWQQQLDHFAANHRVITFDPRSEGESSKTESGNTPEVRSQDLHALLERLKVRHPVLIGWSQGVQDVAAYAQRYGTSEVAGIVLVDAAISDGADGIASRPKESAQQFQMFAVYEAHPREYLQGMWSAIASKPQPSAFLEQLMATGMKTPSSIGTAMLVADMFGVNRMPAVTKIQCRTLIIASSKSDELQRQQAIAAQIPNARFEKIDDAAHAIFLDQPARFNEALSKFLETVPPAP